MKRRKKTKRVRKAKKRKMIRILTPPKPNLVNRNASNNKESINDFIEHFDTKLYWIINRTTSKTQRNTNISEEAVLNTFFGWPRAGPSWASSPGAPFWADVFKTFLALNTFRAKSVQAAPR